MAEAAQWMRAATMFQSERHARFIDSIAVALAVSLPWSTSATGILVGLWLVAVVPALDVAILRRTLATRAGGIPVLLWILALIGMLWAFDVTWAERWAGLKGFHKFLLIPLLIVQFQRSERAAWVLNGFLLSCGSLLVVSWLLIWHPELPGPWNRKDAQIGVPAKDYIAQSGEFTFCIFVLAALALKAWQVQRRWYALAAMSLALV